MSGLDATPDQVVLTLCEWAFILSHEIKEWFSTKAIRSRSLSTMRSTGTTITTTTLGESVRAFVPRPLPPAKPPLAPESYAELNRTAYFSPSWTAFQADRGRDFSVIVDGVSN